MMSNHKLHSTEDKSSSIEKPPITAWDAGWNVSNAIQGMFVLGLPYAILHGGYFGIFFIVIIAPVCYYTGKILIDCLYVTENGQKTRAHSTYVEIANSCWGGNRGGYVVNAAQLIELLMTCVLYIVAAGDLMASSFPLAPFNETGWSILATLFLIPCVKLTHLRAVSLYSMGCSVVQIIVLAVTIIYCLTQIELWSWNQLSFNLDIKEFPISIGVIVFSYTSQIFLPSLEGNMENRKEFKKMLCWSYVASCLTKAFFAVICFLTWAESTKDVATDNLPDGLRAAVNTMLVAKALLSFPLPYYLSIELIEQSFFTNANGNWTTYFGVKNSPFTKLSDEKIPIMADTSFINDVTTPTDNCCEKDKQKQSANTVVVNVDESLEKYSGCPSCYTSYGVLHTWAQLLRFVVLVCILLMAVYIPHFALLMGLTGSLTGTSLAFLLPCSFFLQKKWKQLSVGEIILNIVIFIAGIFFATVGIYSSIVGLVDAYNPLQKGFNNSLSSTLPNNVTGNDMNQLGWLPDLPKHLNQKHH